MTKMPRRGMPQWLERLDAALRDVQGDRLHYSHAATPGIPLSRAPWPAIPPAELRDMRSWWDWAASFDLGEEAALNLHFLPLGGVALPAEYAAGHADWYCMIAAQTQPAATADSFWSPSWMPLVGSDSVAWAVDVADDRAPVIYAPLDGPSSEIVGYGGVRYLAETLSELLEHGFFRRNFDQGGPWDRSGVPLPESLRAAHVFTESGL